MQIHNFLKSDHQKDPSRLGNQASVVISLFVLCLLGVIEKAQFVEVLRRGYMAAVYILINLVKCQNVPTIDSKNVLLFGVSFKQDSLAFFKIKGFIIRLNGLFANMLYGLPYKLIVIYKAVRNLEICVRRSLSKR